MSAKAKIAVITLVGAGCIAAAGVGGYFAVRLSGPNPTGPLPQVAAEPLSQAPQVQATPASTVPARPSDPVEAAAPQPAARNAAARVRPAVSPAGTAAPSVAPTTRQEIPQSATPPVGPPDAVVPPVAPPAVDPLSAPPTPVAEPARPRVLELTVTEGSVIGLRLEDGLSSETARVEDQVSALVTRDVTVDGYTAIPAGARLEGHVVLVERGGRFNDRARLGIRFSTLVLGDRTRLQIDTDVITRLGESPTGEASSKIGASAVVGSILGAVIGGKKGAAIGGAAGAAGGTAAVAAGGRNAAMLSTGTALTARLSKDLVVKVIHETAGL